MGIRHVQQKRGAAVRWNLRQAVIGLVIGLLLGPAVVASPGFAGDSYTANGDCWRFGTPVICRESYAGANTTFTIQWISQMSAEDPIFLDRAIAAMNSWNNTAGPQFQAFNPNPSPTRVWLYVAMLQGQGFADHTAHRGDGTVIFAGTGEGYISYGDIRQDYRNASYSQLYRIWLHEFGHTLMLGHHTNENASVMWDISATMQFDAPTGFDIGPIPPCSGQSASYRGLRCTYNYGF